MSLRFGILVFPNVQQLDLTGPYEVMATVKGAEVELIWKDRNPVTSSTRLSLTPTATFEDCPPLDVLCVPGGGGVNALLEDKAVLDFVWERAAQARYITSVCSGALVLGAAGLLKGKRATTHWYAHDFLEEFGAVPVDARIVEDGRLITAGGVTSGIDFGLALVARLLGQAEAEIVQLSLEYAPAPPFRSGTPAEASPSVLAEAKERLSGSRRVREEMFARWREERASAMPARIRA
ncbi:DJ-1/PfpI family protein [Mesorhizobium sp. M2D.F.Ca.ET.185.01.1.1]|uniref:DJ-1/PfpI family protein n=1 Tax=unclassified Mesorhizobium TaxID=325217 RepID=UPI000FCC692C|nr:MULTISPECIES: DJ-1/PfpI family protein [unclassified Mesorhizobium]TGP82282.1 DJ-1/PfpI family protein [bacterium M00.F.Ca.ET.227.01.1.1]TGP91833.1 DJ-1/PfpI family protein [bacterium M00.F.Ca.ET.221.01.1.1]TGP95380.1 DJ-1/PfpI family protein [bacterium M00.F.Ca.ET.222.01.1.1]TGU03625.1 DJ-1/PfpI family protein [bacterium M00.F.Ca.ET.163.01.1.1]TGU38690.1 DJ-1/PfpI family protein [bacterium M00.F.Ca.ET.156.01.1.1]TGU47965.1 DJ-1/PfpI family protein [bacterium M00.F.Ca.ET.146.01.1.1]TGV663